MTLFYPHLCYSEMCYDELMCTLLLSSVFAGFFSDVDSEMAKIFGKVAAALSSDLKFAHTSVKAILDKYGYKE